VHQQRLQKRHIRRGDVERRTLREDQLVACLLEIPDEPREGEELEPLCAVAEAHIVQLRRQMLIQVAIDERLQRVVVVAWDAERLPTLA
jgi:hypothetical protein